MARTQEELETLIKRAQDAYYNGPETIMSDAQFDELWDELKQYYPNSELLDSVGNDHTEGFKKAKHLILMGSQNKANTIQDMNEFFTKVGNKAVIIQNKMDGISCELIYKNGVFIQAITRGDGCLDFNTVLQTDKGPLKIGDIVEKKIQCKVKAKDLDTNEVIWTPITNWFINKNDFDWYELQTESGKTLRVTGNHLVWLPKKKCFRQVQDLAEGDEFDIVD